MAQVVKSALISYMDELEKLRGSYKDQVKVNFVTANKRTFNRYKYLYSKEPYTIKWLTQLTEDDCLWDVGANIGIYSVFAAVCQNCKVVAVEPGAGNYYLLNENIRVNDLQHRVSALPFALASETKIGPLFMHSTRPGDAINQITGTVDDRGNTFTPAMEQQVLMVTGLELVERFGIPFPTAIKIDVDGAEVPVLEGLKPLLGNPQLQRVTIEVNDTDLDVYNFVLDLFESFEFEKTGSFKSPFGGKVNPIANVQYYRPNQS